MVISIVSEEQLTWAEGLWGRVWGHAGVAQWGSSPAGRGRSGAFVFQRPSEAGSGFRV